MRISGYPKVYEVACGFARPVGGNSSVEDQSPQNLGNLNIQQVRRVQRIIVRIDSLLNELSCWGLKKPVNHGRCIQNDHRVWRSSRSRRALSKDAVTGLR